MFVAIRDMRFARGRFALMGSVVVLITMLVGLLSGLTAGLAAGSTSAITGLRADLLTFAQPGAGADLSFADSRVSEQVWRDLSAVPGVTAAEPLGITRGAISAEPGQAGTSVAVFGIRPGSGLDPAAEHVAPGKVVLSEDVATEVGVRPGDEVTVGGERLAVAAVGGKASYSHSPVIWTSLRGYQRIAPDVAGDASATVVALRTSGAADLGAADARLHTSTLEIDDALGAISSFSAENGSLRLMRGFLFAISALVIGAFFTVWTIQRSRDIAVLKALGASTGYLLRDAVGQAVAILLAGTAVGTGLAAGLGALASGSVPFEVDLSTTVLPALVLVALGAAGAALAIRRIVAVDPLTALGGS